LTFAGQFSHRYLLPLRALIPGNRRHDEGLSRNKSGEKAPSAQRSIYIQGI
jgi:hypothetical protein